MVLNRKRFNMCHETCFHVFSLPSFLVLFAHSALRTHLSVTQHGLKRYLLSLNAAFEIKPCQAFCCSTADVGWLGVHRGCDAFAEINIWPYHWYSHWYSLVRCQPYLDVSHLKGNEMKKLLWQVVFCFNDHIMLFCFCLFFRPRAHALSFFLILVPFVFCFFLELAVSSI